MLETLKPGFLLFCTRQQGVPVVVRELVLPDGFDSVSSSFNVRDITSELSASLPTSCRTISNHHLNSRALLYYI
ncbi:unnamed protein product [Schistosoma margrebowiei]|uniref:Uncharacterized protein n=1 Tax=Schistosoma margrebowiei TaxID=48269 RepID=A0A183LAC6_9TREM|nr:unnamed protein product [Schistosoma margrebowiei]